MADGSGLALIRAAHGVLATECRTGAEHVSDWSASL